MLTCDHPTYMTYIFHIQGAMACYGFGIPYSFHSASDFWILLDHSCAERRLKKWNLKQLPPFWKVVPCYRETPGSESKLTMRIPSGELT